MTTMRALLRERLVKRECEEGKESNELSNTQKPKDPEIYKQRQQKERAMWSRQYIMGVQKKITVFQTERRKPKRVWAKGKGQKKKNFNRRARKGKICISMAKGIREKNHIYMYKSLKIETPRMNKKAIIKDKNKYLYKMSN